MRLHQHPYGSSRCPAEPAAAPSQPTSSKPAFSKGIFPFRKAFQITFKECSLFLALADSLGCKQLKPLAANSQRGCWQEFKASDQSTAQRDRLPPEVPVEQDESMLPPQDAATTPVTLGWPGRGQVGVCSAQRGSLAHGFANARRILCEQALIKDLGTAAVRLSGQNAALSKVWIKPKSTTVLGFQTG